MTAPQTTQNTTATLIGYLAEQSLHPGTGQGLGAIDQPVAREGGTYIPVIPGSSHKGSIKHAITGGQQDHDYFALFGKTEAEGGALFSDIRLILLPIRSSAGSYKWVTCPYLLERLARDLSRVRSSISFPIPQPQDQVLTKGTAGERIYLEELTFEICADPDSDISAIAKSLAHFLPSDGPYSKVAERLEKQLLVMGDEDFAWFARFGLPVYARNALDASTKSSRNLWYEEHLPADTLMYGIIAPRGKPDAKYSIKPNDDEKQTENEPESKDAESGDESRRRSYTDFVKALKSGDEAAKVKPLQYLQIGGDETVGRGICRLQVVGD